MVMGLLLLRKLLRVLYTVLSWALIQYHSFLYIVPNLLSRLLLPTLGRPTSATMSPLRISWPRRAPRSNRRNSAPITSMSSRNSSSNVWSSSPMSSAKSILLGNVWFSGDCQKSTRKVMRVLFLSGAKTHLASRRANSRTSRSRVGRMYSPTLACAWLSRSCASVSACKRSPSASTCAASSLPLKNALKMIVDQIIDWLKNNIRIDSLVGNVQKYRSITKIYWLVQ